MNEKDVRDEDVVDRGSADVEALCQIQRRSVESQTHQGQEQLISPWHARGPAVNVLHLKALQELVQLLEDIKPE